MIPRKIWFIWSKNHSLKFPYFSVESFKRMNPDFQVNLLKFDLDLF